MRSKRYTRLKLKMLLFVAVGAFLAAALCILLSWCIRETALGVPLAGLYHWVARGLFG